MNCRKLVGLRQRRYALRISQKLQQDGTGFWVPTPDGWAIDSVGCLADGTPTSSLDFVIRIPGNNTVLGYRSVNRKAGNTRLPDLPEVVLDRVAAKK